MHRTDFLLDLLHDVMTSFRQPVWLSILPPVGTCCAFMHRSGLQSAHVHAVLVFGGASSQAFFAFPRTGEAFTYSCACNVLSGGASPQSSWEGSKGVDLAHKVKTSMKEMAS